MAETLDNADFRTIYNFGWTDETIRESYKQVMAEHGMNKPTFKTLYQGIEDDIASIALTVKASMEAVLGGSITNAQAKQIIRAYYHWKSL